MIVAILACVHAHLEALTAVLDHAAKEGATEIVCLGDVIGYGVNPRECLKLLRGSRIAILGNHEEALLRQDPADFNPRASAWLRWTKAQLTSPSFDRDETDDLWRFLRSMQEVVEVGDVTYTHGSPRIPTRDYVVPADTRDPGKMREIFDRVKRVCFVGHSHVPHVYWSDGTHATPEALAGRLDLRDLADRKLLVNVGSVGQSRDGDPRASYATLDGTIVRLHRLAYTPNPASTAWRQGPPETP